jgi:teichuronic acid biosynthesis glycosyltransferase TuaC
MISNNLTYNSNALSDKNSTEFLHVLVVSNHLEAKKKSPFTGIFVDRQIASLKQLGVRISIFDIGTSHSPVHIVRKCLELRRQVRQIDPDLVHGQYGTIVGMLTVLAGRPAVISFCGSDLQTGASISRLRKLSGFLLSNISALWADGLICKSEQLRQALWWRKSRAIVIPSGIDLNVFVPGLQGDARKELRWNLENPIAIVNAGDDPGVKGIDFARKVMLFVCECIPNAELQIISNVEPIRMPLYYQASDVLLCTSRSEGSPNVVKEALACNLPVVSTPVGDVPDRLAGVSPSYVVSRDPRKFGEAVVNILRTRQRCNGREQVVHLSLDQAARRILTVYQSVVMNRCKLK